MKGEGVGQPPSISLHTYFDHQPEGRTEDQKRKGCKNAKMSSKNADMIGNDAKLGMLKKLFGKCA